jgi:hypothetical protein
VCVPVSLLATKRPKNTPVSQVGSTARRVTVPAVSMRGRITPRTPFSADCFVDSSSFSVIDGVLLAGPGAVGLLVLESGVVLIVLRSWCVRPAWPCHTTNCFSIRSREEFQYEHSMLFFSKSPILGMEDLCTVGVGCNKTQRSKNRQRDVTAGARASKYSRKQATKES